ncbi:cobalt-zinc-cadmium resistance protein [Paucibacter soli]|uniref:cobalt-zinc-cadmium resistance protein n=1 Tax=Paucibacter soli TaxID=3133433 RepID=UPI0030A8D34F
MRSWLLVLLSLLLTAQFSWAAAAGYCEHEARKPDSSAVHFGHHEHAHDAHEAAAEKPAAKASVKAVTQALDMDHGHCQLLHAAPACDYALGPVFAAAIEPPTEQACLAESVVPEGPDRPNWWRA